MKQSHLGQPRLHRSSAPAGQPRWRPTVAIVDLDAIRHNIRILSPPGVEVMGMVKANAYGHGDAQIATASLNAGATWLGVALAEEGIRLRDFGITAPILVISEFPPGSEFDALAAGLTPSVFTEAGVRRLATAARNLRLRAAVHLKVDTGTHRLGALPGEAIALARQAIHAGLKIEAVWTHFANAEVMDDPYTLQQLGRLLDVAATVRKISAGDPVLHAANTPAIMAWPATHLDLVRLGIGMYGIAPGRNLPGAESLRAAMTWRSAVVLTKRLPAGEGISYGLHCRLSRASTIATIPVGYADGYPRLLSNRGKVLIRGRRYPVAGLVTMDSLMVDCGDDEVNIGDEVILIGRQGSDQITASEFGSWAGTIADEVVCSVSERVPRQYVGVEDGRLGFPPSRLG